MSCQTHQNTHANAFCCKVGDEGTATGMATDLRLIYQPVTAEDAELRLGKFEDKWTGDDLPIGDHFKLSHLSLTPAQVSRAYFDTVSCHILTNHNLCNYVRSLLEVNELNAIQPSEEDCAVLKPLLDSYAFIEGLLGEKSWRRTLMAEAGLLKSCFTRQGKEIKNADEVFEEEDTRR